MFGQSFGQASTSSAFGQSSFGKPAFSSPGFGATNNSLFGQTTAQQPTTSLFGGTQQQTSTFGTGLFGSQPQATTSTGTSLFGNQQQPAANSTGLFGASGTAFGQNKPAFGGFGGTTSGGGGLFGQSTMFGQTNQAQPATSTLFGGTSSAFGGAATTGTTIKFAPVTGTDTMMRGGNSQTINTRHVCITCMKEYETKSLEELRYEDYKANRKGPQQGAQTTGSFFGSTAQPSMFGANTSTAQPTTSLFGGATENKPLFGQQSTTTFGQPTNTFGTTNSLFGKPNTGFGAAVTTQSNTFSFNPTNTFGQNNATAIKPFGAAAPQTSNLFGTNTSQATPTFGATQTSGFGSFGSNQNQGLNFNQNKPTFNLGGTATSSTGFGFGTNTATNNTSLFGQKPATNNFGLPSTASPFGTSTSFGAQPTSTPSLFNSFNKPTPGFQFNTNTTPNTSLGSTFGGGGSLFGNTNAKPTGSLFGNTTNTGGLFGNSSFGTNTGNTNTFGQGLNTSFNLGGTNNTFNNPLAPQAPPPTNNVNTQQIVNLASVPYFSAPTLYKGILPTTSSSSKLDELILPAFQKNRINNKNVTINANASHNKIKIKPVGTTNASTKSLFDGLPNDTDDSEKYFNINKSAPKRLILLPKKTKSMNIINTTSAKSDVTLNNSSTSSPSASSPLATPVSSKMSLNLGEVKENISPSVKVSDMEVTKSPINTIEKENKQVEVFNIKLTRKGYYLSPTLNELKQLKSNTNGPCIVEGFTIGHEEFGNVCYLQSIDISEMNNLDFDSIVEFRFKEVILYPDDFNKPPVGTALNRPAKVTLLKVWPKDKTTGELIRDVAKIKSLNYEEIVIKACKRMNVDYVSYQPETGSWCFKVPHFSKYGLLNSDEEGESEPKKPKIFMSTPLQQVDNQNVIKEKIMPIMPKHMLRNEILVKEMNRNFVGSDISKNMLSIDETMDYIESSTEALSRHMGTDPYKVQLMKQCFEDTFDSYGFSMGVSREFYIENKAHYSGGSLFKTGNFVQPTLDLPSSVRTLTPTSELDIDDDDQSTEPSGVLMLDSKPNKLELVPVKFQQSRLCKTDANITLSSGRSNFLSVENAKQLDRKFSISWLNYKRTFLMTCNDNLMSDDLSDVCNFFALPPVSNNLLQLIDTSTPCLNDKDLLLLKDHLQVCVQNSSIVTKQNCSFVTLKPGNKVIHEHFNLYSMSSSDTYDAQVWKLCVALWGTLDSKDNSHEVNIKRKENLTEWLESVMESMNSEQSIFSLVTQHKLYDAIVLAQKTDNLYLSGVLSMLGCSEIGQAFMQAQLSHYINATSDTFIDKDILKLMLLTSGQPLYDGTTGIINVCESLNWKLAFGLHLWYLEPSFKSIADVVHKFEAAWNSEEAYCLPPLPQYEGTEFKDLCYHLLVLYSHKSHSLVELLNPGTHSANPLDYRLSWFIMQSLKSLGYSHLDQKIATKYHVAFASQLLSYDLWEFAIFVLMHIEDDALRKHHIDRILESHIQLCPSTSELTPKESFLIETLYVPCEWIYKCKGHLAMYKSEYWDACEYFLKAKEYLKCHQVLFDKVVSVAIMNHQYTFIEDILSEIFANITHSDKNTWWKNGGEWLMKYFYIANELSSVKEDDMSSEISYLVPDFIQDLEIKFMNSDNAHKTYYCELFERLILLLRTTGYTHAILHNKIITIAPYNDV
uniref:Nuclear pore complex protein Nup98-Nup96 n=1 Tax=Cacopsylla melanoneura TaxID=428564 RepID=A0A8D8XNV0_9HEMI